MVKQLCIIATTCSLYVVVVGGCLATTDAIAKHLDIASCQEEAKLSLLDDAHCIHRQ